MATHGDTDSERVRKADRTEEPDTAPADPTAALSEFDGERAARQLSGGALVLVRVTAFAVSLLVAAAHAP